MTPKAMVTLIGLAMAGTLMGGENAAARSVFLNGIDISSARNQTLKNVQIKINEQGDVFLIAPHYQVNEEETYTPLSRYVQGSSGPTHTAPREEVEPAVSIKGVPNATAPTTTDAATSAEGISVPASAANAGAPLIQSDTGTVEKAGTKTSP